MRKRIVGGVLIAASCLPIVAISQTVATKSMRAPTAPTAPMSRPSPRMFGEPYLKPDQLPDSALLVPAPPTPGSPMMARDEAGAAAAIAQKGNERWTLATADAELAAPDSLGKAFTCAAGIQIDPVNAPMLTALLRRAAADFAISTFGAKRKYQRARPFMANGAPTCTPELEGVLRKDGSYPSGHSALGYGSGLILSEVIPTRVNELVARGRSFGDSRRICNVHWTSDIEEGRIVAAATFARLNADPSFQADVLRARKEADALLLARPVASPACVKQAKVLAETR